KRDWSSDVCSSDLFDATRRTLPRLDIHRTRLETGAPFGAGVQVVHGCRQLVSCDVGLSPATSATLVLCCKHVTVGTHRRLPESTRWKVGMTSNHNAVYVLGFTH